MNNLKIIRLGVAKEKDIYKTGPSQFIDYINSASLLVTDSFHGIIFSILLETPFVAYKRLGEAETMYSRIETLLTLFSLKSREACNINKIIENNELFNVDFTGVPDILKTERDKAIDFLKFALRSS